MFLVDINNERPDRFKFKQNLILKNTFKLEDQIGKGSFSNVYKVFNIENNKRYAIKIIKKNNDKIIEDSSNEIKILSSLKEKERHNITKIYNTFYFNDHLCIILKLYNISLKKYLLKYGSFSYNKTIFTISKICETLHFLQQNKIIHRDLKLDNILFKDKQLSDIILIDFSISTYYIKNNKDNRTVQTIWYRAPESYLNFYYDYRIDIWSLGCITYELYFNKILFKCYSDERLFIEQNLNLDFPDIEFIRLMPNKYKNLYDSTSDPSFVCVNNLFYSSKKKKFIEIHTNNEKGLEILKIIFKCCSWDCFKRPFCYELLKFLQSL